ncbi:MAG: hypothetical protein ACFBWO_03890 [Paracoccaceae bacterium]
MTTVDLTHDRTPPRPLVASSVAADLGRLGLALSLFVALAVLASLAPETGSGAGSDVWFGNVALSAPPR